MMNEKAHGSLRTMPECGPAFHCDALGVEAPSGDLTLLTPSGYTEYESFSFVSNGFHSMRALAITSIILLLLVAKAARANEESDLNLGQVGRNLPAVVVEAQRPRSTAFSYRWISIPTRRSFPC
jgi:hypothetical protein